MWRLIHHRKIKDLGLQLLMLLALGTLLVYLTSNAIYNMGAAGITSGFDFLFDKSGYDISYSLIDYDPKTASHMDAWIVGVINTLAFAILAIVLTTIMSLMLAVMRLSSNWLVAKLSLFVVEYIRNVPILVHIFIWYSMSLLLPSVKAAFSLFDVIFLSNRGLMFPTIEWNSSVIETLAMVSIVLVLGGLIARIKQPKRYRLMGILALVAVMVVIAELSSVKGIVFVLPELKGFNFVGGMTLPPEFFTLLIAVSTYSAAHGSEVVRGSIMSVAKGQSEAALAMGAKPAVVMHKIVIPQALRSIVPPMTSVYINVLKAAALGSVIGFMDIMGTMGGSSLNITGQAIECMLIVMVTYTLLNLCLAFGMGHINRKVQFQER